MHHHAAGSYGIPLALSKDPMSDYCGTSGFDQAANKHAADSYRVPQAPSNDSLSGSPCHGQVASQLTNTLFVQTETSNANYINPSPDRAEDPSHARVVTADLLPETRRE